MQILKKQQGCLCSVLTTLFVLISTAGAQITETAPSVLKSPEQREHAFFIDLVKKIEPTGVGVPERLSVYLHFFQQEMINDTRLFAYHVVALWTDASAVRLTGYVEFIENRDALETFLRYLGFDQIENRVEVLPAKAMGPLRYAFVKRTHGLCRAQPLPDAEVVTDGLLGDPLFLLKEAENGFFLCHTAEGYVGFIEGEAIHRVGSTLFIEYQSVSFLYVLEDCKGADGRLIPVGARLKWIRNKKESIVAQLPTGKEIVIPASCCEVRNRKTNDRVERAITIGQRLIGTPYLWGGKTSSGIDCSGLVQVAFAAEGIHLPRDSSQQVYLGRLTATRWHPDGYRRGDTLFFLGHYGKIIHTAIYLGEDQYLESAGPGVRISSLNPEDANYDDSRSGRLAFAKRLLD